MVFLFALAAFDPEWTELMLEYKGYAGTVEADDGAFVGQVVGLRDVVTFEGETFAEVQAAF